MKLLSHEHFDFYLIFFTGEGDQIAFYSSAVYGHGDDTFFYVPGIGNLDMIGYSPVFPDHCEIPEICRYAGIYFQSLERRLYSQDILGNIYKGPGGSAGKPAVFCLPEIRSVFTGYHLGIDIWFGAVYVADIFQKGRTDLPVYLKGSFSSSKDSFRDRYPGIIMAENTGVFLVSRGIRGNFSQVQIVMGVWGLKNGNAIPGVQDFFYRVQSLSGKTFFDTDAGERQESLRFDVDFAFFTFMRAYLVRIGVIGTKEPFSIPAVF